MTAAVPIYPLEDIIKIKIRRVEEQEKVVKEKEALLEREKEKLKLAEEERDKAKQHQQDKLNQLRDEMDRGTTSDKILQMRAYLKIVKERLKIEEKKVSDQKEQVKIAEKNLALAKEELNLRRQEVDKLKTHRKDWLKEAQKEIDAKQEQEMDEIGQVMYVTHKRKK